MNRAVAELYAPDIITLATKPDTKRIPFKREVFDAAVCRLVEQGRFTAEMLAEPPARKLIEETYNALNDAIDSAIKHETPEEMTYALRNNAFIFSGFKTYHTLSEVGLELTDAQGNLKSYEKVLENARRIDERYNGAYLFAEYNHAVHTTQMAVKWQGFVRDGDEYNLQYRTANDERVRETHAALDGITLPTSNKFWDNYLPPNDWDCRCKVVQVLREDFPLSDSEEAIKRGDESTQSIKQQMFRFNAGKTLELFPSKHPYYKVPPKDKKIVQAALNEIKTAQEAVDFINADATRRAWFERGFRELAVTRNSGANGQTDMNGKIWLKEERLNRALSGLTKIRKGDNISFEEADALATLWHEITHNRSKQGNMYMTALQIRYMELANEFVARKTLPEFYNGIGGKIQHTEFMDNRESTGYNRWVRNYCKAIELTGADADSVLNAVREHLFTQPYNEQKDGLVNALMKGKAHTGTGAKIGKRECANIVKCSLNYSERMFEEYMRLVIR